MAIGTVRNNNIFADDVDIVSDSIFVVSPGIELRSDWGLHSLKVGVDADFMQYKDFEAEDRDDYSLQAEGRIDMTRSRFLFGEVSHRRRHEDRGSSDDVDGFEPTAVDEDNVRLLFEAPHGPRQLHVRLAGELQNRDFEDVLGAAGIINNDDRDRQRLAGTLRFGYGWHPAYLFFLQGSAHSVEYDFQFDDRGFERSSTGYEVSIGTALDLPGRAFGDIFVGYLSEKYDDARLDKIDGVSFGADLSWNLSGLTTLNLVGRREVLPSTVADTAGRDVVRFGAGVDHELLRNLILSLNVASSKEDFQGIDRSDRIRSTNFAARYLMNRRIEVALEYAYRRRTTDPETAAGIEFSRNVFSLTI